MDAGTQLRLAACFMLALAAAGCGRIGFERPESGTGTDAALPLDAGTDAGAPLDASADAGLDGAAEDAAADGGLTADGGAEDAGWCSATCMTSGVCSCATGCDCALLCATDNCHASCGDPGTTCTIEGTDLGTVSATCQGSTCETTCTRAAGCFVSCLPGADCLMRCDTVTDCRFVRCDAGAIDCGGGVLACNRACP